MKKKKDSFYTYRKLNNLCAIDVNQAVTGTSLPIKFHKPTLNVFQKFGSYFLFSAVTEVLFHHRLPFVLIFSSCERLLHLICALHYGIIMSINSTLKNQVTIFVCTVVCATFGL